MSNKDCFAVTCPECGARLASKIALVPVQGLISVERTYNCGRLVHFSLEMKNFSEDSACDKQAHSSTAVCSSFSA